MLENKKLGFGTIAIHNGNCKTESFHSLNTPIYLNASFPFESCQQAADRTMGKIPGFFYSRAGNPTLAVLENQIAKLEKAEACIAFCSGMASISAALLTACKAGSHIIANSTIYGCTNALLEDLMTQYGVEITSVDLADLQSLRDNLRENTAVVYLETPANPNLKIVDIQAIAETVHTYNKEIKVICDNTFASPYLTNPLEFGCDVVVQSATKYINGHGDVLAGFVCGKQDFMQKIRDLALRDVGGIMGPFEAYMVLRGLKTMEVRMERHCDNAEKIAAYLSSHPMVEKVYYPGLETHPGHEIAKRQMRRFGGMLAFEIAGGKEVAVQFLETLNLCLLAASLGDAETLIEHPASMTHSLLSPEQLVAAGIPAGLIRMSVGLENAEDIIADLDQAFAAVERKA